VATTTRLRPPRAGSSPGSVERSPKHSKESPAEEKGTKFIPHSLTARWLSVLLAGLAVAILGVAHAAAQPVAIPETWGGDLWSRPRLTGSWGGLRDELGKKGWCSTSTRT